MGAVWADERGSQRARGDSRMSGDQFRDKRYLRLVRQCACAVCKIYSHDVDPHHLMGRGSRGAGMKAPDDMVIPLCRAHHNKLHDRGAKIHTELLEVWGIDAVALSADLFAAFRNGTADMDILNRMRAITMSHRGGE